MSREIFDHKDFNGLYDVVERANKFITWTDDQPLSDQPLPPPVANDAINFMVAICRFVGEMHMDDKTEDEARALAKGRMDVMQEEDLRVLAEEAMVFEYRVFPGEMEEDGCDGSDEEETSET